MRSGTQYKLFDEPVHFPNGLVYQPNFITPDEEEALLVFIESQDLRHSYGGPADAYEAKRRSRHFGSYIAESGEVVEGPPLPRFLTRFARRIEKWLDKPRGTVIEALINEYTPGTALGWHRDNEPYEHIVGISLAGWAKMRWRAYESIGDARQVLGLELEPRSAYIMQGDVRWQWQHSVVATRTLRYSITFRTLPRGVRIPALATRTPALRAKSAALTPTMRAREARRRARNRVPRSR